MKTPYIKATKDTFLQHSNIFFRLFFCWRRKPKCPESFAAHFGRVLRRSEPCSTSLQPRSSQPRSRRRPIEMGVNLSSKPASIQGRNQRQIEFKSDVRSSSKPTSHPPRIFKFCARRRRANFKFLRPRWPRRGAPGARRAVPPGPCCGGGGGRRKNCKNEKR